MNIAELFKKNFVLIPVIASVLFGTFAGVKYIVNLDVASVYANTPIATPTIIANIFFIGMLTDVFSLIFI